MAFPDLPAILRERTLRTEEIESESPAALLRIYAWMHLARTGDNRILDLFRQGFIKGTVAGGQGNEGLIVPLALLADKERDVVAFTHRDFGGHLIWSGHLVEHLNQYFANAASPTKAREGNVHHGDPANRSLPMISHLGAMASNVLGATDAQRRLGHASIGFALFGDGGSSTGDIHECFNLASLLSLPVIFIIENNGYAYSTPVSEQYAPGTELWRRASGYGIEALQLDATDVIATARTLADAIERTRRTGRPLLIEAKTLRLRGHAAYDTCDYLRPGEADAFLAADPLPRFRAALLEAGHAAALQHLEAELDAFIEASIRVAHGTPRPLPESQEFDVYAPSAPPKPWIPSIGSA